MSKPLAGLRVVELAQFAAGPAVGLLLADLGAEVIKVESPEGDPTRTRSLHKVRGESAYFMHFNRGKQSVVIDLKQADGREVLNDLLRKSDAFISNLRPGALEKLKLDYENLRVLNPRLVAASVSGFGTHGAERDRPSFDALPQAMSGLMSLTGEAGRTPVVVGTPIGDLSAGMFAVMGLLAALLQRTHSGVGQHVDISMLDSSVWLVGYPAAYYFASAQVPGPMGSGHENAAPYGAFLGADGRHFFLAAHHIWEKLCDVLDRPDLKADTRFATHPARLVNRAALDAILGEIFLRKTSAQWLALLAANDIPAAPVNNLGEAFDEPLVCARNMRTEVRHPDGGVYTAVGNPMKFSAGGAEDFGAPPRLGADTARVLTDIVGYAAQHVERLAAAGAIRLSETA